MAEQIKHMVIFNLIHPEGSQKAQKFLADGQALLTSIPVVRDFQVSKQVSPKNDYAFGFSMVFDSAEDYEAYNGHPVH